MPKFKEKINKALANRLRPIVDEVGKNLYNQLYVVTNYMNIDIKSIFESSKDYDQFWQIVANYYNDYCIGIEEDK